MGKYNIANALQQPGPTGILAQPIDKLGEKIGIPIRQPAAPPPVLGTPPLGQAPAGHAPATSAVPLEGEAIPPAAATGPQGTIGQQTEAYGPDNPTPISERFGNVVQNEQQVLAGMDAATARTNVDRFTNFVDKWRDVQTDVSRSTFADIGVEPKDPTPTSVARRQGATEVFDYTPPVQPDGYQGKTCLLYTSPSPRDS